MDYSARTPGLGYGTDTKRSLQQQYRNRQAIIISSSSDTTPDFCTGATYPQGYNPLCPTCRFLSSKYGPDDGELILHCRNYDRFGNDPTDYHYKVGDPDNPNLNESHSAG